MYPDDRRYTREHEWAKAEKGRLRVGITAFAAERLSDVVFIELPEVGAEIREAEPFGGSSGFTSGSLTCIRYSTNTSIELLPGFVIAGLLT